MAVLNDDLAYFSGRNLSFSAKQKVVQVCSVSVSAKSPAWVDLVASWGFDLNAPVFVDDHQHPLSWLWYALARGNVSQSIALVKAGVRHMDVNTDSVSGLGMLVKENVPFTIDRILPILKLLGSHGLGWQNWPDAQEIDGVVLKAMGKSLGDILAQHDAVMISNITPLNRAGGPAHSSLKRPPCLLLLNIPLKPSRKPQKSPSFAW
jgi:hypothetical protein